MEEVQLFKKTSPHSSFKWNIMNQCITHKWCDKLFLSHTLCYPNIKIQQNSCFRTALFLWAVPEIQTILCGMANSLPVLFCFFVCASGHRQPNYTCLQDSVWIGLKRSFGQSKMIELWSSTRGFKQTALHWNL